MARSYDQLCPIARTLDIIGERWTLLVLRELAFGRSKFSELQQGLGGIPSTVLSDRLKTLDEHGLVQRVVYREHPLRAEYRLTETGESLRTVLAALARWGLEHTLDDDERARVRSQVPAEIRVEIEQAGR